MNTPECGRWWGKSIEEIRTQLSLNCAINRKEVSVMYYVKFILFVSNCSTKQLSRLNPCSVAALLAKTRPAPDL
jgi:hypothetical protein